MRIRIYYPSTDLVNMNLIILEKFGAMQEYKTLFMINIRRNETTLRSFCVVTILCVRVCITAVINSLLGSMLAFVFLLIENYWELILLQL